MPTITRHIRPMRQTFFLKLLLFTLLFLLSITVLPTFAQAPGVEACAVTPSLLGGQGFNVSGQGFNVSGQGFNVSGQGFNVSGQGFNVSGQSFTLDPVAIAEEIRSAPNRITPGQWVVNRLPFFLSNSGFNTKPTAILIVDEFDTPDAHGFEVQKVVDDSLTALRAALPAGTSLRMTSFQVPIDGEYEASELEEKISNAVDRARANGYSQIVLNMSFGLIACEATPPGQPTFNFEQALNVVEANNDPDVHLPLQPLLECVIQEGHKYRAYFGYQNDNAESKTIPVGTNNKFYNSHPLDRGQPSFFEPGRQHFVFSVLFNKTETLTWKVKGVDNVWRYVTATRHSPQCGSSGKPPAPAPVSQPITPIFECVIDEGNGHYTARFGYNNPNQQGVKIPVTYNYGSSRVLSGTGSRSKHLMNFYTGGVKNEFSPDPENRSQPTTFAPGLHQAVFTVSFTAGHGKNLTWRLGNRTAVVNLETDCLESEGFGVSQYITQNLGVPQQQLAAYWDYLTGAVENDDTQSLRLFLRNYLAQNNADFSVVAVASSGNLRPWLGDAPLAPAAWPEVIGVGATLGNEPDTDLWQFSQNGDVVAPGASYPLDPAGSTLLAGTSFASPAVSVLLGMCATVPNGLTFENSRPPLLSSAFEANGAKKLLNAPIGTTDLGPLACSLQEAVKTVNINIKPLSPLNRINLQSHGKVSVAILSDRHFNAPNEVNPHTVTLAGAPVIKWRGIPLTLHLDVNFDGRRDLVVWVRVQDLELTNESTQAVLRGETYAREVIQGTDSVRIVPPHAPRLIWPRTGHTMLTRIFIALWEPIDEEEEANTCYLIQIDNNSNFSSPEQSATVVRSPNFTTFPLPNGRYFWRVAVSDCMTGTISPWSETWQFTVRGW